jgi:glycosyltransferase involved in cell wall biosynthesis
MFFHDFRHAYTDRIDRFIAPSEFVAQRLLGRGIEEEKVAVIPNFVDTERWQPSEDGAGDYILFTGRLSEEKGIETLIRAVAALPDVPLKVVGSGMLNHQMRSLAAELGADNVEFIGFKNEDEVRRLVRGSRFVCVPSEWFENAPMSALEAFACGKPVVGSNIGGIPEMVRDGQTGLLAEPGDVDGFSAAIDKLWHDEELCLEMGRVARTMAENEYSPEIHYQQINETYKQVKRK